MRCLVNWSPNGGFGLGFWLGNQENQIRWWSADDRRITGEPIGDLAEAFGGVSCCRPAAAARLLQVPFRRLLFRLYPASQLFVTHTVGDEHHIFAVIHHRYFNYRKSSRISRRTSAPIFSLMCLMMPSMASFSTMR